MRSILGFLIIVIIVLLAVTLSLALVLGLAMFAGWLLTKVAAFTFFEATLLGLIALIAVSTFWIRFFGTIPSFVDDNVGMNGRHEQDHVPELFNQLPVTRFYKTADEKTWDAWLRYQIAEDIYFDLQAMPTPVGRLDDPRVQELAIRLAEIALAALRNKPAHAKELHLTKTVFKRQMNKMGQQAYDDDILNVALATINSNVDYFNEELRAVIVSALGRCPPPCPTRLNEPFVGV